MILRFLKPVQQPLESEFPIWVFSDSLWLFTTCLRLSLKLPIGEHCTIGILLSSERLVTLTLHIINWEFIAGNFGI